VDTSNGSGAMSTDPPGCAMSPRIVPLSTLPDGLTVIAVGEPDPGGVGGDITYYDHPGGGFVFAAGSLTFVMRNVMQRAGIV
jgi:hypothetical protein